MWACNAGNNAERFKISAYGTNRSIERLCLSKTVAATLLMEHDLESETECAHRVAAILHDHCIKLPDGLSCKRKTAQRWAWFVPIYACGNVKTTARP